MRSHERRHVSEARHRTNASLKAERGKTDGLVEDLAGAIGRDLRKLRETADEKVQQAREQVDEARAEERPAREILRAAEAERRATDTALGEERVREDRALRHEQDLSQHVSAAVGTERRRTNERLTDERQRADGALERSEEPFRLLVDQVKDYAIFMLDPAGNVVSWNSGAERLKGYRFEEIRGKHFSTFYTAPDVAARKPEEELEVALRDGRVEAEGWRVRKDGSTFLANVVITALHNPDGTLRGFAKVTRDVTERFTSAERALERSEETLRLATEAAHLGTWDWRIPTDELIWSEQTRQIFAFDPGQKPSFKRTMEAVHPDDRDRVQRAIDSALDPRFRDEFELEYRIVWPDGSVRWVAIRGVVVDVTDRMAIEHERQTLLADLQRALQARDDFVAVLTHDLRSPMAAISLVRRCSKGGSPSPWPPSAAERVRCGRLRNRPGG